MNRLCKSVFAVFVLISLSTCIISCSEEKEEFLVFKGEFNQESILGVKGFSETLAETLTERNISKSQFDELSKKCLEWKKNAASGQLSAQEVADYVNILLASRNKLFKPIRLNKGFFDMEESTPVFQKTIPLSEIDYYINNRFRDIRGKVEYIGDIPYTETDDLYYAYEYADSMGFLYPLSPLSDMVSGGYAVIRFRAIGTPDFAFADKFLKLAGDKLNIKDIMFYDGLSDRYEGGITGCGLNNLQIPEYFYPYTFGLLKGEIYEITPKGRGILRAVFSKYGWEASEGNVITKAVSPDRFDTAPFNTKLCNGITCFIGDKSFPAHLSTNCLTLVISQRDSFTDRLGFTETPSGRFALSITEDQLHKIDSFGIYYDLLGTKQGTFFLRGITPTGDCILTTDSPKQAEETNMICTDIGTYQKIITVNEIDTLIRFGEKLYPE